MGRPVLGRLFPRMARDVLYPSEYIHLKDGVSCRKCGCDPNRQIDPDSSGSDSEEEEDSEPRVVVHRGTITSGELVIKDGKKRDQLAAEHGVLCFETEAAGALAAFPFLVIRGISNYCDSHKNDEWQGYAAAVAAAYARQLFFHMPIEQTKLIPVSSIEEDPRKLFKRIEDMERREGFDLVSMTDGEDSSSRKEEGTGRWLLEAPKSRSWPKEGKQTPSPHGTSKARKNIPKEIPRLMLDMI